MIIYKIEGNNITRFEGAKAKASAHVTELVKYAGGRRSDYVIKEVDLDVRKEALLAFLNKLCEHKEG